jgi:hypothetical protein
MIKNYDDIINLLHHTSKVHPRMNQEDRAAQFAPFAALTGYAEAINEAGRLVDKKKELTNEEKEIISNKINYLISNVSSNIEVLIIYFIPDDKKIGGSYHSIKGIIKFYDQINKTIKLTNKRVINLDDILTINSEVF